MKKRVLKGICALLLGCLLVVDGVKRYDNMSPLEQGLQLDVLIGFAYLGLGFAFLGLGISFFRCKEK